MKKYKLLNDTPISIRFIVILELSQYLLKFDFVDTFHKLLSISVRKCRKKSTLQPKCEEKCKGKCPLRPPRPTPSAPPASQIQKSPSPIQNPTDSFHKPLDPIQENREPDHSRHESFWAEWDENEKKLQTGNGNFNQLHRTLFSFFLQHKYLNQNPRNCTQLQIAQV